MTNWISVKDKLPDHNDDVLIYIEDVIVIGYLEADGEWDISPVFEVVSGRGPRSWLLSRPIKPPTHWMPLPEPPKEK